MLHLQYMLEQLTNHLLANQYIFKKPKETKKIT